MPDLPAGRLTFLFTDIVGSTSLWLRAQQEMRAAMVRHDALIEDLVVSCGGAVVRPRGEGDSRFAVFQSPADAVTAAWKIQMALRAESWATPAPISVRIGIHAGEGTYREGDYYGPDVNRCARIRSLGHPGQTLLTRVTRDLVEGALPPGLSIRCLGRHNHKDLPPEVLYQLVHEGADEFPPLASAENPNNLPAAVSSFVGREEEVTALREQLRSHRLITLIGPGGCGKTRLSQRVAGEALEQFPDGVWWVELAPLTGGALVTQAVATALGVREEGQRPLAETLADYLHAREALLVLDNCEHLVEEAAALAAELLKRSPRLRVLTTSREALAITGEHLWRVSPLDIPEEDTPPGELRGYAAVRLFEERARAAVSQFEVNEGNGRAVAQICRYLDGIPLALELAAPLVRVMPVNALCRRLSRGFPALTGGSRTAEQRQKTLRSAVEWGYNLLTEAERRLFCRLSVFSGGFNLPAVETVALPGEDAIDWLANLVDKSFVVIEEQQDGDPAGPDERYRYRLLEILRQYGQERLAATDEAGPLAERHAEYYLELARTAEPQLQGPDQPRWLDVLETEYGNIRAALTWSIEARRPDKGLLLAGMLWRFWYSRGRLSEGRKWLEDVLALGGDRVAERARALNGAANLANAQGDFDAARKLLTEALDIFTELEDETGAGHVLNGLGIGAHQQGDYAGARRYYEQSLERWRAARDPTGTAHVLNNLAIVAYYLGDYEAARGLYEESLALRRELGAPTGIANSLSNLGYLLNRVGEQEAARQLYQEAIQRWQEAGDQRGVSVALHGLAEVLRDAGEPDAAASLFLRSLELREKLGHRVGIIECVEGIATLAIQRDEQPAGLRLFAFCATLRETVGTPVHPSERAVHDRWIERARESLAPEVAERLWTDGAALPEDKALELARAAAGQAPENA